MIEFYVSGQNLKLFTPVIAADTLKYLTCKVYFDDNEWDGYTRWLHFRQEREGEDALVYDLLLNADDETTEEQTLNLTIGEWEIYLTGTGQNENRLTTLPLIVTVKESGLVDAPLHVIPLSVAEQLDAKAELALSYVLELRRAAERGEFTGKGFPRWVTLTRSRSSCRTSQARRQGILMVSGRMSPIPITCGTPSMSAGSTRDRSREQKATAERCLRHLSTPAGISRGATTADL